MTKKQPLRGLSRKNFKRLLEAAAALVSLLLAAAIVLFFVVPRWLQSHNVKQILTDRLEQSLGRPVSIGKIIVAPSGIKLSSIEVGGLTPGEKPVLSGFSVVATIKLAPLFKHRLEIGHLRLSEPQINLRRGADGRWNVSDLFASSGTAGAGGYGWFKGPPTVDLVEIENATLEIEDALEGKKATIEKLSLTTGGFRASGPIPFSMTFNYTGNLTQKPLDTYAAALGRVDLAGFDREKAWLAFDQVRLSTPYAQLNGRARLNAFKNGRLSADFSLSHLSLDAFRKTDGPAGIEIPASHWRLSAAFAPDGRLAIAPIKVEAPPLSASGSAEIDVGRTPAPARIKISLAPAPLEDYAPYLPFVSRYRFAGSAQADLEFSRDQGAWTVTGARGRVDTLRGFWWKIPFSAETLLWSEENQFSKLTFTASQGKAQVFGQSLSEIKGSAVYERHDLDIEKTTLGWDGSRLQTSVKILGLPQPRFVSVDARLDTLSPEKIQSLVQGISATFQNPNSSLTGTLATTNWVDIFKKHIPQKFPDTSGRLRVGLVGRKSLYLRNADVRWNLGDITPDLQNAAGEVRLSFGPGEVVNIKEIGESDPVFAVIFLPYVYMHKLNKLSVLSAATAYPDDFKFTRIRGQYGVQNGVVTTRYFRVESPQMDAFASGTADFAHEQVDMSVLTRLSGYPAALPTYLVDESGHPAIAFNVKGDLNHPTVELRMSKMTAGEIEGVFKDALLKAGKFFKNLVFKGG